MQESTLQKGQYVSKRFRADPGDVEVKDAADGEKEDGRKQIRMPVSSTAQDRDGDQFSEDGLEDLQRQFNEEKIPMFLDHGRGSRGSYYGTLGIVGRWDSAEIEQEGDLKVLYATGTPTDANPDAADAVELIQDDMPVGASVGFRVLDYDGDRQDGYEFHKSDLLETSLVGIPSNPETVNAGPETGAVAAKSAAAIRHRFGGPAGQQAPRAQMVGPQGTPRRDLLQRAGMPYGDGLSDGQQHRFQTTPARDAPTDTMDNDNPETDDDTKELLERLVSLQERTVEEMDEQRDRLDDLEARLSSEERDADPDGSEKTTGGEDGDPEDDDVDERRLSVVLDEDASEKAVEEFETLKQHATGDGEIDLADSETRLFESTEETDDADATDGGLI